MRVPFDNDTGGACTVVFPLNQQVLIGIMLKTEPVYLKGAPGQHC